MPWRWSNYVAFLGLLSLGGAVILVGTAISIDRDILAVAGGGLAAAAAAFLTLFQFIRHDENARSRFHLEEAQKGISKAYGLLENGNSDRATWVLAARILKRCLELERKIDVPEERAVYEIFKDDHRNRFSAVLLHDQHHRASFFVGAPKTARTMEDVKDWYQTQDDPPLPLSEDLLRVIYEFARYPEGYNDPLEHRWRFSDQGLSNIKHLYPSLFEYIRYRRQNSGAFIKTRFRFEALNEDDP